MKNVLVTGATGLLRSSLVPLLQDRGHHVTRLGHSHTADINADLVSYEHTNSILDQVSPEIIINLVAMTNVDRCETHPQEAYLLNVKPTENLCSWMRRKGKSCHLIQISSDQLYDGPGPHSENEVTIRNHYAMSKLAGEFAACLVNSTILRTNFVGRSMREGRVSLTDWLHDALIKSKSISVFEDVMFSPLAIGSLCECIERCIIKRPHGVFNLGSRNGMSKADFAFMFASATGLPTSNLVRNNSTIGSTFTAFRPTDMRMLSDKFEKVMGLKLPSLINEIQVLANEYS